MGVPQGSVLSSILFTISLNDLQSILATGGLQYSLYADDLIVYSSSDEPESMKSILQRGINGKEVRLIQ
jgi:hypothetical protein